MTRSKHCNNLRLPPIQEVHVLVEESQNSVAVSRSNMPPTIVINDDDDDVRISSPRSFAQAKSSLSLSRQRNRSTTEHRAVGETEGSTNTDLELRLGLPSDTLFRKVKFPIRRAEKAVPREDVLHGRVNLTIDLTTPSSFDADCILVNEFVQKKRKPNVPHVPAEPAKELKLTCAICMDTMKDETSTICGHIFCARCIEPAIRVQKKCPTCRQKLTVNGTHRIYISGSLR